MLLLWCICILVLGCQGLITFLCISFELCAGTVFGFCSFWWFGVSVFLILGYLLLVTFVAFVLGVLWCVVWLVVVVY